MNEYPIIDISAQAIDEYEAMGTKSKFWYTDPSENQEYIFKSIHTQDKHGNPTVRNGENWSEKIACEIAKLLGLPHAHYDLAQHNGQQGTRSPNFTNTNDNMVFGNQLLERIATTLDTVLDKGERSQRVELISIILKKIIVNPPLGWKPTKHIKNAHDIFLGYLMFDTIISNQDRHSQNWAMIETAQGYTYLSPSFDHGASLGRNESDAVRIERLQSKDIGRQVQTYVKKCKSHFYFNSKKQKTIEAFLIMGSNTPEVALEWLERLNAIDADEIVEIVDAIPSSIMSTPARLFSIEIILVNILRLLSLKNVFEKLIERNKESSA
ncbi:TPA: HipA domain-containing protein [Photobacterium damselae]